VAAAAAVAALEATLRYFADGGPFAIAELVGPVDVVGPSVDGDRQADIVDCARYRRSDVQPVTVRDALRRHAGWVRRQLGGRSRIPEPLPQLRVVHARSPELYYALIACRHTHTRFRSAIVRVPYYRLITLTLTLTLNPHPFHSHNALGTLENAGLRMTDQTARLENDTTRRLYFSFCPFKARRFSIEPNSYGDVAGWLGVRHSRYCIKTTKPIGKLFGPSGRPIT